MISTSVMNLILGFVGKKHFPKMYRVFDLTRFGAKTIQKKLKKNPKLTRPKKYYKHHSIKLEFVSLRSKMR